ncbi:hypothetical protein V5799_029244 [Amblyomma americanum]|uniref:Uncharacterized protein n=1 Tax=Amblyomma americanum TaxID=6943 RepID=A0AAQ4ERW9_AMBAM
MLLNGLRIGGGLCWKLARSASSAATAPSRVSGTSRAGRSTSKARLASTKHDTDEHQGDQSDPFLTPFVDRDDDFSVVEEPEGSLSEQSRARIQLLKDSLGCSLASATSIVMGNRKILGIRRETLVKNVGMLKSLFPVREIMRHPEIFSFPFGTAEQRYRNLEECGIKKITPARVIR